MKGLVALMTLSLLPVLVGCGASLPTEKDARKAFQEEITEHNQNRLKIVNFHKTNAESSEVSGVPHYKVEFEGEIEVAEDCAWVDGLGDWYNTRTKRDDFVNYNAKKGLRRTITGWVWFEKAENGWRLGPPGAVSVWFKH